MPPSLRSAPPEPEGTAGPRVPIRRASFSPQGLNPAPPLARVPHRLAPAPRGRSPPLPSPHPSLPRYPRRLITFPSLQPLPRLGVPFPLPGPASVTQHSPRPPLPAPTASPPRRTAPPARDRGVRNKARGAAGPGAAAMLAGAANKGVRPEAPARSPAGRGRCAGAARTMRRSPPFPGRRRPSARPTRSPRGARSSSTH